jgi:8-oxo-dGTP diphosphatase
VSSSDDVVRAAGGIVHRRGAHGIEVLLVHRPKYDDWSFPKGKLDGGETDEDAALREVEEETGYRCVLGDEVGSSAYVDARSRPKTVRYWAMTVVAGAFEPNSEVDVITWLPLDESPARLTHAHDGELLAQARPALEAFPR